MVQPYHRKACKTISAVSFHLSQTEKQTDKQTDRWVLKTPLTSFKKKNRYMSLEGKWTRAALVEQLTVVSSLPE